MSDALFVTACFWLAIGWLVGVFVTRRGLRYDRRERLRGKRSRQRLARLLRRGVEAARRDEAAAIEQLIAECR